MSTDLFLMAIFFPCISFFSFSFTWNQHKRIWTWIFWRNPQLFWAVAPQYASHQSLNKKFEIQRVKSTFTPRTKNTRETAEKLRYSEREHFSRWGRFSAAAAALSEVLKSSPCSRPPGMRLWILAETPTRASWENGPSIHTLVPSSNSTLQVLSDHRRISTAVCIRRRGTEAEKARADYQLAFDLSLALHVGIYEFHCRRFFLFFFLHTSLFALHKSIHLSEQLTSLELDRSLALRR